MFLQEASSQATIAVDGEKRISVMAAYTIPYIRVNSFTVDLGDPTIVGSRHNYTYGLLHTHPQAIIITIKAN